MSCLESLATYRKGFHHDSEVQKMRYCTFGKTGLEVSLLGFGGASVGLVYGTQEEQEGIDTVIEAVKSGVNYIDTAPFYSNGNAERVLGKALKHIPRNTYYIATKVGRYGPNIENLFNFSAERTEKSIHESLKRLNVDYIDVLQIHDVEFAKNIDIIINETLPVLQKYKDMGKAKYIGITGYPISLLKEIVERSCIDIDMVLSYCRCTLFDNSLKNFLPFFKERNVGLVNAAVLGMGLLTDNGPPDWHPAGSEIQGVCKRAVKYCQDKNVNISKLAAYYSLSQHDICTHLIGMQRKDLLKVNLSALKGALNAEESIVLENLQTKFFGKNPNMHWENKDIIAYWEAMKKLKMT